jgi:hypothetical protein
MDATLKSDLLFPVFLKTPNNVTKLLVGGYMILVKFDLFRLPEMHSKCSSENFDKRDNL